MQDVSNHTCDPARTQRFATFRDQFVNEGAAFIPGALLADEVRLLQEAYQWKLDTVGDKAMRFYGGQMLQALGGHGTTDVFQRALRDTAVGDIAAALFGSGPVWFMEEQIFYKESLAGEPARRTAWHQDGSYQPFAGTKNMVIWIPFDELFEEEGLEVVRGSHRGPLYNGITNDPDDDTKPAYPEEILPRVPDIEADRSRWNISSSAFSPGDVLVFHARTLHGGGPCLTGRRRRSLALRFFGDDVFRVTHPGALMVDPDDPAMKTRPRVSADEAYLGHFAALDIGEPISRAIDWSVRPWVPASPAR
jgi:hypothetical protein